MSHSIYHRYIEGFMSYLSGVTDNALYPIMIVQYASKVYPELDETDHIRILALFSISAALCLLNFVGLKIVGWVSSLLLVFCLLPFIVLVVAGLPKVHAANMVRTRPFKEVDWGLFLNTLFWNLNYFDSVHSCCHTYDFNSA